MIGTSRNQVSGKGLITSGDLTYRFLKQKMRAHEVIQKNLREARQFDQELPSLRDLYVNSVTLKALQFYMCYLDDVLTPDFEISKISKRCIIQPLNLYWAMKWSVLVGQEPHCPVYFKPRHDLSLEKTAVMVSFRDILVLVSVAKDQQAEFGRVRREPGSLLDRQLNEEKNRGKELCPSYNLMDCVVHDLSLIYIEDSKKSFYPILELNLQETQLVLNSQMQSTMISALIAVKILYFNPRASRWEPLLERSALGLDFSSIPTPSQGKKKYFFLDLLPYTEVMEISISLEMIEILSQAIKNLQKKTKKTISQIENGQGSLIARNQFQQQTVLQRQQTLTSQRHQSIAVQSYQQQLQNV